jgi:hypothetical protein
MFNLGVLGASAVRIKNIRELEPVSSRSDGSFSSARSAEEKVCASRRPSAVNNVFDLPATD